MSRERYLYLDQRDFRRGICQEPENAEPGQVLDARNVWAPDGLLQTRPGYESVRVFGQNYSSASTSNFRIIGKDGVVSDGSTAVNMDALTLNQYWYVGLTGTLPTNLRTILFSGTLTANSNNVYAQFDYWNGERWKRLNAREFGTPYGRHLVNTNFFWLSFIAPEDWVTTSVSSTTAYWIRCRPVPASWATVPVTATNNSDFTNPITCTVYSALDEIVPFSGVVQFAKTKQYVFSNLYDTGAAFQALVPRYASLTSTAIAGSSFVDMPPISEPSTLAVIPEFNIAYLACGDAVLEFTASGTTTSYAAINSQAEIVGTISGINSPYHPDEVPQLAAFPNCKYLIYAKGTLWAAGLKDEPFTVRWSAPAIDGAHNVWPEDSFAILSEDDNSPITGLALMNEQLVIFKRDSIWLMVPVGVSDLDLPVYNAVKVVSGVGCVSQSSIKSVRGRLVFLAEDGIYSFNGTPNVEKISDPVDEQIAKINKSRRPFATAVNWTTQGQYLLSVALNGSVNNNFVFVYDYNHNAWWFWDNIEAQSWLLDEGVADEQTLYFTDRKNGLFQFGIGQEDNGAAIDSYILTHRMGQDRDSYAAREVEVTAYQDINDLAVTLYTDDQERDERNLSMESYLEWKYDGNKDYGTNGVSSRALSAGAGTTTNSTLLWGLDSGLTGRLGGIRLWIDEVDWTNPLVTALSVTINGYSDADSLVPVSETWTVTSADDSRFYDSGYDYYFLASVVVNSVTVSGGATTETLYWFKNDPRGLYTPPKRRQKHLNYLQEIGQWFQVKVAASSKYCAMKLQRIRLGVNRLGRR